MIMYLAHIIEQAFLLLKYHKFQMHAIRTLQKLDNHLKKIISFNLS